MLRWIEERLQPRGLVKLADACAKKHRVRIEDIFSRTRTPAVVNARRLFATALHLNSEMSYMEIGRLLDRDHTTVIAMVRKTTLAEVEEIDAPIAASDEYRNTALQQTLQALTQAVQELIGLLKARTV
jgi:chromosomal replication initiation ATPase DnaA